MRPSSQLNVTRVELSYGYRKIRIERGRQGEHCSEWLVRQIMTEEGLDPAPYWVEAPASVGASAASGGPEVDEEGVFSPQGRLAGGEHGDTSAELFGRLGSGQIVRSEHPASVTPNKRSGPSGGRDAPP